MPLRTITAITAKEIADLIGGSLHGANSATVTSLTTLEDACPGSLVFVRERSAVRIKEALSTTKAEVLIAVSAPAGADIPAGKAVISVGQPAAAMSKCIPLFFEPHPLSAGINPLAAIDPSAKIGKAVSIGAYSVVGALAEIGDGVILHPHVVLYPGAKIGAGSILHSNAVIREDVILGANTVIQNGAVIGADGFGLVPDPVLGLVSVPQVGTVRLSDRVEVGANTCIDRGTLGETKIGLGTKIDNLVQVGHNTRIGQFSILCGQAGIAGSCEIGNQVVIGGNAGVADHLSIADGVRLAAKTGATFSITEKGDYGGYPAFPAKTWMRIVSALGRLPEIAKRLKLEEKE